jgi:cardiolipin synthase A/B
VVDTLDTSTTSASSARRRIRQHDGPAFGVNVGSGDQEDGDHDRRSGGRVGLVEHDTAHYRRVLEGLLGIPFTERNRVDVLRNGCRIFPAMLDAIASATISIEFLTFVYWTGAIADRFADALAERARAGVCVRVVLDAYGAALMPDRLVEHMEAAGVEVRWFRPLMHWKLWSRDNRTHRKVLVLDGRIGFTGGVGIAEEWEGDARSEREWRDTHFRIAGPAVHGIRAAFYENWMESGGVIGRVLDVVAPVEPAGTARVQVLRSESAVGWSDIASLFQIVIGLAKSRIRFATPYFSPDDSSTRLLVDAAGRGVDIEILIPGPHADKRVSQMAASDEIEHLLEAGVAIWRYQPTMLHAKIVTLDGILACIGSANFNHRSMLKDDEVALVVDDPATIAALDRDFDEDLRRSERLDGVSWRRRGVLRRSLELLARPFREQA